MRANPKPVPAREIELDFIRGLAILMVLDFHSPAGLLLTPLRFLGLPHFGWAGVDLFFVLSGFLVGGLLIKEWLLRGSVDTRQFLIRRGFKIWPQYYAFLGIMLLTGHRTVHQLWGNLLNIQNYTGGIAHTWTLAVEEHAYLLVALILAVAAWRRARMRTLFFLLATMAAAVVCNRMWLAHSGVDVFTRTDTRVDGILYGVMLAMLYHGVPQRFAQLQRLRWIWIGVPIAALLFLRMDLPFWWARPLSWLSADFTGVAIILLLYRRRAAKTRSLPYRVIAAIGLYSYGIYLWHVSVVAPVESIDRHLPTWLAPWWMGLAPYVLGISLGVVFTRLVEFPALKLRERLFPRRVDSAAGIPAEMEQPVPSAQYSPAAQRTVP